MVAWMLRFGFAVNNHKNVQKLTAPDIQISHDKIM